MIRLIIAEDHQAFIDGIAAYLEYNDEINLIKSVANGEELIESVRKLKPDVVITDLRMPKLDGLEATKIIKKEFPNIKVLALTMFDQLETVKKLIEAGASGYLLKNSGLQLMIKAIKTVIGGANFYDPNLSISLIQEITENVDIDKNRTLLSKREKEILYLIAKGKSSLEIAEILFISKTTVDTHRKNMCRKLNLKGSNMLLQYALESKFK